LYFILKYVFYFKKYGFFNKKRKTTALAVRKLKSEDLAVYINGCRAKKDIKETTEWAKRIASAAVV
jgi:hypothetical protein